MEMQIKISLKLVTEGPINNIPALVKIMACRRPGDKPLYQLMMIGLLTHIFVTRPQRVKLLLDSHICHSLNIIYIVYYVKNV